MPVHEGKNKNSILNHFCWYDVADDMSRVTVCPSMNSDTTNMCSYTNSYHLYTRILLLNM